MKKTLLVGLDAACWEYLEPLLEAGRMPALQRLMEAGCYGTLGSTMPPWTPAAWATLVTGKNPGRHGIFDMLWRRPGSYDFLPTDGRLRRGTPFWQRLNEQGIRVGLVNVPFTYPPQPLNGFVVAGFGTPASATDVTYPPELRATIGQKYETYEPAVAADFLQSAPPAAILETEIEHQARQVEISLLFSQQFQVDVLVINLMLTDHANHKMPDRAQVAEAYAHADSHLDRLLSAFGPDNVMLISDHGSNRLKGDFLLNAWLRDQGYLVQARQAPAERSAALNWILLQWLHHHRGWSGLPEKVLRRLLRALFFRLPAAGQQKIWDHLNQIIPFAREHVLLSNEPDYEKTRLFPASVYSGLLYLNVAGREPSGQVPAGEQAGLAAEIAARLGEIRDPETGEPLFSKIYTGRELYSGPALAHAPDLIIDSYDSGWNIRTSKHIPAPECARDRYFVAAAGNRRDFGWHSRDGMFVFAGPDFCVGPTAVAGQLTDIPATLLHLYDVPIPDDYDGRVLSELLTEPLSRRPVRRQPGDGDTPELLHEPYTNEEAEELVGHLRALGYLD